MGLTNPRQIAKVTFLLKTEQDEVKQKLISQPQKNYALANLQSSKLGAGSYRLLAQAVGWNGQFVQTQEIKLTTLINKTADK